MGLLRGIRRVVAGGTRAARPTALLGTCELRAGRLTGTVTDAAGGRGPFQVEVVRVEGITTRVLASAWAKPERSGRRCHFSLAAHGLIDGAELLDGKVRVVAIGGDGGRGELSLDGAHQLELIRAHMSLPAETVLDLDFGREGNARPHLGPGWSFAEPEFTWTLGEESIVTFDAPSAPGRYVLRMTAGALIKRPEVPRQELSVFVDDALAATIIKTEGVAQFEECRLDFELFRAPRTTLRLLHPNARRPCDLGANQDQRRLAFSMRRVWMVRLLEPDG